MVSQFLMKLVLQTLNIQSFDGFCSLVKNWPITLVNERGSIYKRSPIDGIGEYEASFTSKRETYCTFTQCPCRRQRLEILLQKCTPITYNYV